MVHALKRLKTLYWNASQFPLVQTAHRAILFCFLKLVFINNISIIVDHVRVRVRANHTKRSRRTIFPTIYKHPKFDCVKE
jgi:hypothetical protein